MENKFDPVSTVDIELGRMRSDISKLSELIEVQNTAIDNAVNMSCSAKNRSIDFSNRVVDLSHDVSDLKRQICVWRNTCIMMTGWILAVTLLWVFGII